VIIFFVALCCWSCVPFIFIKGCHELYVYYIHNSVAQESPVTEEVVIINNILPTEDIEDTETTTIDEESLF